MPSATSPRSNAPHARACARDAITHVPHVRMYRMYPPAVHAVHAWYMHTSKRLFVAVHAYMRYMRKRDIFNVIQDRAPPVHA